MSKPAPSAPAEPPVLKPCCARPAVGELGWRCPMHPQVTGATPGSCALCGMELEPIGQESGALADRRRDRARLVACGVLAATLMAVSMLGMGAHGRHSGAVPAPALEWLGGQAGNWLQFLLATPIVFWGGWPILSAGWAGFRGGRPGMFSLIGMGVVVAWTTSVLATVAPGIFPAVSRRPDGSVEPFFESAGMIVVLVMLGQWLESGARRGTTAAIRALMSLAPATAERIGSASAAGASPVAGQPPSPLAILQPGPTEETVPLALVRPGDLLRVRPGGRIPTDGIVREGSTTCDESLLTGEPMPAARTVGDRVLGGAINGAGTVVIEAETAADGALVARIARLVREAHAKRAPIERLADRIATVFVPLVLVAAVATFLGWALWGPEPRLASGLLSAVSVLVIACPCSLGLATPLAMTVGIGRGARAGILARSSAALERLAVAGTIVFDKTGTITGGRPRVVAAAVPDAAGGAATADLDERPDSLGREPFRALVFHAASLEEGSEHPLARAFAAAAAEAGIQTVRPIDVEAVVGRGVTGRVAGTTVAAGSAGFLQGLGISTAATAEAIGRWPTGTTTVHLAVGGRYAGAFGLADPPRPEAAATVAALTRRGHALEMLSGDEAAVARRVGEAVGIASADGGLSPLDKAERVARLRRERAAAGTVVFVGDGVNDAPALAEADVGIAMGSGADVALETADVTLLSGGLAAVPRALALARATMANVRQNLCLAFVYNLLALPVAAGALYPLLGHVTSPMLAAAAMSLSSLSVIGNALRLRRLPLE